ncbi:LysR family transcriptional regulator [Pseudoalteromonas sp. DL2-H2.2]|uniref:LysR family transcriptional regulator n=1 Tax=Pseudoalteromonas sp. DL2-H2.2 TaxID=2908889 RepID=UPI001F16FF59|nr:LysR family transcriptional regulator [Pseudoalteromonas sp. DL2-H2.2]MCF2909532.1 LysR family transcriptional regulator [Pseudoalteromonas sp. DL2-H2.2]
MQVQDVDLRLLRIFVAIVECGGLSAAESRLNIGRSTISSHLSDLEVRLGLKLCKRGRSGFELTEPGRVTYQASLELLQQCEAFASTVASSKNELSGRVTIATIDTMVSDPRCGVARAISALKARGGNIQFDIQVCEAREVETSVVNGRSLVGLGVSRHQLRGLDYYPLHNEYNYLYCAQGHPLFDQVESDLIESELLEDDVAESDSAKLEALLAEAEVITSNYLRDKEVRNDGLNYQNSAIAYHDEGIAHLILSGEFIGYLPEHYASYWVDKGIFRAIQPEKYAYQIPVMLITSKSNSASPLAEALIEEIKRVHDRA